MQDAPSSKQPSEAAIEIAAKILAKQAQGSKMPSPQAVEILAKMMVNKAKREGKLNHLQKDD